jgi:TatA/E family protein of Tat protein translocase
MRFYARKGCVMFGIGTGELIVILIVALIIIGPQKLPEIAKSLGKAMGEVKRATRDIQDELKFDDLLKDEDPPQAPSRITPPIQPPRVS